jgi:hypothetical protein
MVPPLLVMMAFATGQKALALDAWDGKDGEHSPFAKVLFEHRKTPQLI